MGPINRNDSKGKIAGDRRHVFVSSFVYDLPLGPGKWQFSNAHGVAKGVVSRWQFSGVISGLSGAPFSPSFTTSVVGSLGGRPNVVPGQPPLRLSAASCRDRRNCGS